ncbi:type II secretion system minor pseudopilin GspH [Psychromonas antarctica]|uniref:type II secretion system minor pseudopilin GspH n=1 Tax=Psychromonas antarctica TaxID=67573 RepID=UPI001EE984E6|nr:type II secretion system minor pseudopilin GspH [Psychromonas antarctica]MCG6200098.1 type II secretion system minor pseudopilin GspH [Psychromonas antarctica]
MLFKTPPQNSRQAGFTLLEIMLVLLLMGMISVGVMMTMPEHIISEEDISWQAQRFNTVLQFAEDEALISGIELGVFFEDNSYQFVFYDYPSKKWLAVISDQLPGKVELPESIQLEYLLSGSVWDEIVSNEQDDFIDNDYLVEIEGDSELPNLTPQVYIMSSGEVTPFELQFSERDGLTKAQSLTLSVSMSGKISFSELVSK